MQTQTSTSTSVKRRPAVKKTAKGNGVTIPEPKQASKGSARTLYKYSGKKIECKTAQMIALIKTVQEAKKGECTNNSVTSGLFTVSAHSQVIIPSKSNLRLSIF